MKWCGYRRDSPEGLLTRKMYCSLIQLVMSVNEGGITRGINRATAREPLKVRRNIYGWRSD